MGIIQWQPPKFCEEQTRARGRHPLVLRFENGRPSPVAQCARVQKYPGLDGAQKAWGNLREVKASSLPTTSATLRLERSLRF